MYALEFVVEGVTCAEAEMLFRGNTLLVEVVDGTAVPVVTDFVDEAEGVFEAEATLEGVAVPVPEAEVEDLFVCVGVGVGVTGLGVLVADAAYTGEFVGVAEAETAAVAKLGVAVGVGVDVAVVMDLVEVGVLVGVGIKVCDGVADLEGVFEGMVLVEVGEFEAV